MDINHLAVDVFEWAEATFPDRTDASMFLKLYKELGELIDSPSDDEFADVMILMLDFAKRKKINPSMAIQRKLAINKTRQWELTGLGVYQHVS